MKRLDWQDWHAKEYFPHLTPQAGRAAVQAVLRADGVPYEESI